MDEVLEILSGSRSRGSSDADLDDLLDYLDDRLDIASLASLERVARGAEEPRRPEVAEVDRLLEKVDVCSVSTLLLMSLLRFTYRHRAHLPHWDSFRDLVVRELRVREPGRWENLLGGLLE
jgi:hypothetical protein